MAKAKMKHAGAAEFSSEAKEAEWWDARRPEVELEVRQRMRQKPTATLGKVIHGAKLSQPVTLRIPKGDLEIARRLAAKKGLGYQTYIKMLLREALAKNAAE
jgi:predicted DNA binding CopG/RHH family protein